VRITDRAGTKSTKITLFGKLKNILDEKISLHVSNVGRLEERCGTARDANVP